jgi:hypothetical protein
VDLQRDLADAELGGACLLRRPLAISGSTSRSRGVSVASRRSSAARSAPAPRACRLCASAA